VEYIDFTTEASTTEAPTTEAPAPECVRVEDGVCIQSCTGGGCTLKCLNSDAYHSCEQSRTGRFKNAFL